MTSKRTLLSAAVLAATMTAGFAFAAQHTNMPAKKDGAVPAAVVLVVPVAMATDDKLGNGNGCWARLYDGGNYTGSQYVLVGPVDIPAMRDGLGINEKYDSIAVGPKATLTVYDNENYRDRSAVLKPASRTPDLDDKMAVFETIRSLKVSCAQ